MMVNRRIFALVVYIQTTLNCICLLNHLLSINWSLLTACMKGIDEWMTINNLKLNKSKTNLLS